MATQEITAPVAVPQVVAHSVERERTGWRSWVTTTDHKRIGIMYLVLTFVFFLLGGTEALLIRLQLAGSAHVAPSRFGASLPLACERANGPCPGKHPNAPSITGVFRQFCAPRSGG